jgi:hypothetical protein
VPGWARKTIGFLDSGQVVEAEALGRVMVADSIEKPVGAELAVRCHDVTLSLAGKEVGDFEEMIILGMAVRLALHLRGVEAISYDLLKKVGLYLLRIPTTALKQVITLLAEVEFVRLDQQGQTIRSVIPTVPFYEDLFEGVGEYGDTRQFSEAEALTLAMVDRLSGAPTPQDTFYNVGAGKRLVDRMVRVGSDGGYVVTKRARGREMLLSPIYFYEHADAFADLAAGRGSGNVAAVVRALSRNQGWPLSVAQGTSRIGDTSLSPKQMEIVQALAGAGFAPPPAIRTSHAGENHFIFAPKASIARLAPSKKPIFEAAMALVAAVRQGQLLPREYAIRSPQRLLMSLREKRYLRANTEALEQYRRLVVLRLGRLRPIGSGWARFELIDIPENIEAVDMAIALFRGDDPRPQVDEDVVLAFRKGDDYVESLVARQQLAARRAVKVDPDTQEEIDNLLLRGSA